MRLGGFGVGKPDILAFSEPARDRGVVRRVFLVCQFDIIKDDGIGGVGNPGVLSHQDAVMDAAAIETQDAVGTDGYRFVCRQIDISPYDILAIGSYDFTSEILGRVDGNGCHDGG